MTSRREFLEHAALVAASAQALKLGATRVQGQSTRAPHELLNIIREPDLVEVQIEAGTSALTRSPNGRWTRDDIVVSTIARTQPATLNVSLAAPTTGIRRIHLRWRGDLRDVGLMVGDAWERGYGDFEWRGWAPDRVMPWYIATTDGRTTNAYGVRTGARAFAWWEADLRGLSLWLDVRSGAAPLALGQRTLDVCDVISRGGRPNETAFAALHAFCAQMCPRPRIPAQRVYGHNDWYWVYGKNSAESVMTDVQHIVELSPPGDNRPFAVIDDGWQPVRGKNRVGVGRWDLGNEKFPDMAALAADMKRAGAKPGIWIRPLQALTDTPDSWRLPRDRQFLDPTIPDVRRKVVEDVTRLRQWGFEMIKHDYTTFDILGRWGYQMGSALTRDGWTFASGATRTTAEVIDDLYLAIREGAGESAVIGCNTVSHLSAGRFEICRIGDDTSGTEWPRTRKMGVNTLAFRGVQHGAFYVADADCVGVTNAIPWERNRQWLDLLAQSGTMLFVSLDPAALGAAQRSDLKVALALAAAPQRLAEPVDWKETVCPSRWRVQVGERTYDWTGPDGAGPP